MKNKRLKFFETAKETAEKNGLVLRNDRSIFDFSLLDSSEISDREKAYIKHHIFNCGHHHFNEVSYIYNDKFYNGDLLRCGGIFNFKVQRITPENVENRYYIFTLVKIQYTTYKKREMIIYNYKDDWINEYDIYKCEGKWMAGTCGN